MITADAHSPEIEDTPLTRAWCFFEIFYSWFGKLFQEPRLPLIPSAAYRKASAWLRGLEELARRVLLPLAVALIPDLPPTRPRAQAQPDTPKTEAMPQAEVASASALPDSAPLPVRQVGSFRFLPRPVRRRPDARRSEPLAVPRTGSPFIPFGQRYNALFLVLKNPEAAARRYAFCLRAWQAKHGLLQMADSVRLDPDQERHLVLDIEKSARVANDALRRLFYASRPDTS